MPSFRLNLEPVVWRAQSDSVSILFFVKPSSKLRVVKPETFTTGNEPRAAIMILLTPEVTSYTLIFGRDVGICPYFLNSDQYTGSDDKVFGMALPHFT